LIAHEVTIFANSRDREVLFFVDLLYDFAKAKDLINKWAEE